MASEQPTPEVPATPILQDLHSWQLTKKCSRYKCPDCGTVLFYSTLDRHRKIVCNNSLCRSTQSKWKWLMWKYESLSLDLSRRQKFECNKKPQFVCILCNKRFSQKYDLTRHLKRHFEINIDSKFQELNTSKYESLVLDLSHHQKFECNEKPQFVCNLCNKCFSQKCSLSRHLQNKHLYGWSIHLLGAARCSVTHLLSHHNGTCIRRRCLPK